MNILLPLLGILYPNSVLGQENKDSCAGFPNIITDYTEKDCKKKGEDWYLTKKGSCFPTCEWYSPAVDYVGFECIDNSDCIPGFECDDETCYPLDGDTCLIYHAHYKANAEYNRYWKPECTPNGKWKAKQCKGDVTDGRCFCYDEAGKRLFGQQWITQAENMTCACSRRRADLLKNETIWFNSFHCDNVGNYESLQCDSGICWCADPKTGEPVSTIVPEASMKKLPCFRTVDQGDTYLRQCESQKYAEKLIERIFKQHGTNYANFRFMLCDEDGTYGAFKIDKGQAYCTWRDNSKIMPYQSTVTIDTLRKLTCNCARDGKYFEQIGQMQLQQCNIDGEYLAYQNSEVPGYYYCVDYDGYKTMANLTTKEEDCTNKRQ